MSLTQPQKRYLRRLGHDLHPLVRTGSAGLTDGVLAELERALGDHELVKIRLLADDRAQRTAYLDRVLAATGAELVQRVGHVVLLYRPNPEKRRHRIALP